MDIDLCSKYCYSQDIEVVFDGYNEDLSERSSDLQESKIVPVISVSIHMATNYSNF